MPAMNRRVWHAMAITSVLVLFGPTSARATTIMWEYDLLVHGTAFSGQVQVDVPLGTPMVIDLAFDSNSTNACGDGRTYGTYLIGGTSNTVRVGFLGYQYGAFGGIEVGGYGPCGGDLLVSGVRLFVGPGSQIDPAGIPVNWADNESNGDLFLGGPPPPALGALPTTLPTDPYSTYGVLDNGSGQFDYGTLRIDSVELRAVPEPISGVLLGIGLIAAVCRRRHCQKT